MILATTDLFEGAFLSMIDGLANSLISLIHHTVAMALGPYGGRSSVATLVLLIIGGHMVWKLMFAYRASVLAGRGFGHMDFTPYFRGLIFMAIVGALAPLADPTATPLDIKGGFGISYKGLTENMNKGVEGGIRAASSLDIMKAFQESLAANALAKQNAVAAKVAASDPQIKRLDEMSQDASKIRNTLKAIWDKITDFFTDLEDTLKWIADYAMKFEVASWGVLITKLFVEISYFFFQFQITLTVLVNLLYVKMVLYTSLVLLPVMLALAYFRAMQAMVVNVIRNVIVLVIVGNGLGAATSAIYSQGNCKQMLKAAITFRDPKGNVTVEDIAQMRVANSTVGKFARGIIPNLLSVADPVGGMATADPQTRQIADSLASGSSGWDQFWFGLRAPFRLLTLLGVGLLLIRKLYEVIAGAVDGHLGWMPDGAA